jgi:isoleucyl-tRNA synthetase
LAKIVENGHVTQGAKPVNWCFDCGSALAEAEIEYQDRTSPGIDVLFASVDPSAMLSVFGIDAFDGKVGIPIWTTTPWTLPANQAVALHGELPYVLLGGVWEGQSIAVLVAEELAETFSSRIGLENVQELGSVPGSALEHLSLKHPFYDREVPVILGEHVTTESGTGAVHTAPGHGEEDFQVGRKYDLPITNPVGGDGVYLPETGLFAGQFVWRANDSIIEKLREEQVLLKHEPFEHSYPHCWRHKSPTAFRVTPQWFISMDKQGLRAGALDAIKDVRWVPTWGEDRISSMIENRPDWCISRQRTWGVPITLFVDKSNGELHPDTQSLMQRVADEIETQGVDCWYEDDIYSRLGVDAQRYERVNDILDVWFDSGVSHRCVLDVNEALQRPADMYLEGSDQHRGWFHSSLLSSVAMHGEAPYKEVLTHGFTVDADGKKMSKSLGNVIAPQKVMNSLGADVLRLWVASADYSGEITVSDEILKRVSDGYRRIRNTARFLLGNLDGFEPSDALAFEDMLPMDRWAVDRALQIQDELKTAYDNYQFMVVHQKVTNYCGLELSAVYLDVIKDRLYTMHRDSRARKSAQTAMYHILEALVRWVAPIISFTAEEIWALMPGEREESIFMATWYEGLVEYQEQPYDRAFWQQTHELINDVNAALEVARADGDIGGSLAAIVQIWPKSAVQQAFLDTWGTELRFPLIVSEALVVESAQAVSGKTLDTDGYKIGILASEEEKCVRCWHQRKDVGQSDEHPELCGRCIENVDGDGEDRKIG